MLDLGDFAIVNVRIHRELRRRRHGRWIGGACHRGDVGNVDLVGNVSDIGNVDNLGDAGNLGDVGNVRLRLKQYRLIVDSNVNVAHNIGWQRSNRNSVGFDGDQQSWG